jgi:hypothetical protein
MEVAVHMPCPHGAIKQKLKTWPKQLLGYLLLDIAL